jgi:uncharacterized protein YybS (DUF2232 family)
MKEKYMNMRTDNRLKVIGMNLVLFAALFGLVSFNKEVLRPAVANQGLLKTLTGCFPNFIAAYLISLGSVVAVLLRKPKRTRLIVYGVATVVAAVLIVEEIHPMFGASEHFDIYDIVASLVGSLLAITTFELIIRTGKWRERLKESEFHEKQ